MPATPADRDTVETITAALDLLAFAADDGDADLALAAARDLCDAVDATRAEIPTRWVTNDPMIELGNVLLTVREIL